MGDDDRPLCVLLLDAPLEQTAFRRRAEDLLRSPNVVAVEPARLRAGLLAARVAQRLVKRLPGTPRLLLCLGEAQRDLARTVSAQAGGALWVAGEDFDAADDGITPAFRLNAPLWDRLEAFGIAAR